MPFSAPIVPWKKGSNYQLDGALHDSAHSIAQHIWSYSTVCRYFVTFSIFLGKCQAFQMPRAASTRTMRAKWERLPRACCSSWVISGTCLWGRNDLPETFLLWSCALLYRANSWRHHLWVSSWSFWWVSHARTCQSSVNACEYKLSISLNTCRAKLNGAFNLVEFGTMYHDILAKLLANAGLCA